MMLNSAIMLLTIVIDFDEVIDKHTATYVYFDGSWHVYMVNHVLYAICSSMYCMFMMHVLRHLIMILSMSCYINCTLS